MKLEVDASAVAAEGGDKEGTGFGEPDGGSAAADDVFL